MGQGAKVAKTPLSERVVENPLKFPCPLCMNLKFSNEGNQPFNYKCMECGFQIHWDGKDGHYFFRGEFVRVKRCTNVNIKQVLNVKGQRFY